MLDTQVKLARFIERCEANKENPSNRLRLRKYESEQSYLHTCQSPLVAKVDKLVSKLGVTPWKAVLLVSQGLKSIPKCKHCKTEDVAYYGSRYRLYCSRLCAYADEDRVKNISRTIKSRYDVNFYVEKPEVRAKLIKAVKSEATRKKIEATCLARYGHTSSFGDPEVYAKTTATVIQKYGSRSEMLKSKAVRQRFEQNCLDRRGVRHPSQDPSVQSRQRKSAFGSSDVSINGKTFKGLQGYEQHALEYLASKGLDLRKIQAHPKVGIPWKDKTGKSHVFHPDFKIKGKRHLIEVKSLWTLKGKWGESGKNTAKKYAALANGYRITFLVMDKTRHVKTFDFRP
jgi:hypothetical protein